MELLLHCGPGAALSHQTAAYLHGFDGFDDEPEVLHVVLPELQRVIAPPHRVHRSRGDKIHRTSIEGLHVTSAVLTLVDLVPAMKPRDYEKTFDSARRFHKNLEVWFAQFAEHERYATRPAIKVINRLFAERGSALDSIFEVEFRQELIIEKIRLPIFGYQVFDQKRPLIKLDAAWLQPNGRNVAAHCDGWGTHSQRKQFERDAEQRTRLSVLGWVQIIVTKRQLKSGSWKRDLRKALGI